MDLWDQSFINRCVWGGGRYFQGGGVKKKYCCVRGRGGHYMKNKNIGEDVFCKLDLISKKGPNAKMRKKCKKKKKKKISNIENFPRSFRSLGILQNSYFWSS